jgi:hypothetical protein
MQGLPFASAQEESCAHLVPISDGQQQKGTFFPCGLALHYLGESGFLKNQQKCQSHVTSKEDEMRKAMFFILVAIFAAAGLMTQAAMAQEQKPPQAAAAAKEARWHGVIVNINEQTSSLDVRRQRITRTVYYDSSTKWTEGTKTTEMKEFKVGSDVICLGKFDEKGNIHATRIDLRVPKAL